MVSRDHRNRTPPSGPVESEQRDRIPLWSLCRVKALVTGAQQPGAGRTAVGSAPW